MHVIVLASQKGGSGKTTLTGHLAVAAEQSAKYRTVLIDTDPQGSLSAWWNARKTETPAFATSCVAELAGKLKSLETAGYDLAFIDTPPAIQNAISSVVGLADLVLIPTRPSPHDLRAVGSTVELVMRQAKPFLFVLAQAKPNTRLMVQAMAALSAHGAVAPAVIHDRIDFAASMIDGRTVQETEPNSRSAAEIAELWDFVQERLHGNTKARKENAA